MSKHLTLPSGFAADDLVFNENFSGSALSSVDWNTYMTSSSTQGIAWDSNGLGGSGVGGTLDADYDEPSEVTVDDGLTLNAVQQSVVGVNYVDGALVSQTFPVTAGVVDTYGKVEFDGGYLQIGMKQPSGDGSWPSLWLLPGAGAGNVGNNFEIDVQEGGYDDGAANPNDVMAYHLHTSAGTFGGVIDTGMNLTASFNTYAINWIPGKSITWYLNGVAMAEITSAEAPIPNEPMELIMSNQVATSAASSWRTSLDGSTPQSMPMQIDGVQLYQTPGSGETITGSNVGALSAPTVTITTVGGAVSKAKQTISGTVDLADSGSTVSIYDGSNDIGSAIVASDGQWSTSVNLDKEGVNVLTAQDTNAAGTGVSALVDFTLHGYAPTVTISTAGGTVTQAKQTISGTVDLADTGSTVSIYDGSNDIGSAIVASDGQWSTSVTLDDQGVNTLTARDTNAAGTGVSAVVDLTLNSSAPTVIDDSGGDQTYSLGDESYQITLGGFYNDVTAGNGNDSVSAGAGEETIALGNGDDSMTFTGYGNTTTAGNGTDTVSGGLGNNAVKLGNGADSVDLGGYYNDVNIGNGADIINAGAGYETITAGNGADTVSLAGYNNSLQLGAGDDVVNGGQGGDNITLSGGSATVNLQGNGEKVTLFDGVNAKIIDLGSGLTVDVESSDGADVITGLAQDLSGVINLMDGAGGYSSIGQILGALRSDGQGGSLLSLGATGSIDVVGVAPSKLGSSNFGL